jgi:hypothetical protein
MASLTAFYFYLSRGSGCYPHRILREVVFICICCSYELIETMSKKVVVTVAVT